MSFLTAAISNMSETDKSKLGKSGSTRISNDGSHKVKISSAYEAVYEGSPYFTVEFEDVQGKKAEHTLWLTSKVGEKDGVVQAGMYPVNGVQTQLNNKGDVYDNVKAMGQIKNLWTICGLDEAKLGEGVVPGKVKAFGKEMDAEIWQSLIGKELTIVTSYEVSADKKDPKKCWRNQKVSMTYLFNKDGLSQFELDEGKTEPKALEAAVKLAKAPAAQYADIGYSIKYSDQNNMACKQELKLLANAGTVPTATPVATNASGLIDEEEEF